jgi:predicted nucleotidyltransferase
VILIYGENYGMPSKKLNISQKEPDSQILSLIARKIVEIAHPRKIILFGSAARGSMKVDSDLDILVIMPDGVHRRKTAQSIYLGLSGIGFSKDIVVVTETDVQKHGNNTSLVLYPALSKGKVIYHEAG